MPLSLPRYRVAFLALGCFVLSLAACSDEPKPLPLPPRANTVDLLECPSPPPLVEDISTCFASDTDYPGDAWPACISDADPNQYSPINPSISTIARVESFDKIANLLWNKQRIPSAEDFAAAREEYALNEGLDSRVQRREDVHFDALPDGKACNQITTPEQYPERCAGPVKILPILNDAFAKGIQGETPRIQARRIEAALLWFLYLSSLAETQSCDTNKNNCDSAWAYYTGGTRRDEPVGLAAYVRNLSPATHNRAYDGALAVRCWRDVDSASTATNTGLQQLALKQYDRALIRGIALVIRQRAAEWKCAHDEGLPARQAFVQTLLGLMEAGAVKQQPELAQEFKNLQQQLDNSPADFSQLISSIDNFMARLFPCP
jgi:hypothetical protein